MYFFSRYEAIFQIASGLRYLHSKNVYHCDLKSANVLVQDQSLDNTDWTFWLCDVGETHMEITIKITRSVRTTRRKEVKQGTVSFDAPEVFLFATKNQQE